jgi:Protein of unknown function (DUF3553)
LGGAAHHKEFDPIADGPDRADKIMADTRAEKGGKVWSFGHVGAFRVMNAILEPGMLVRHPTEADWGIGQVQSNIGDRITVNFEHRGKVVIDGRHVTLILVYDV